jgi:ABC-2 type transport system permease protein
MSDVIHDIGFRHYAGERLGRGWVVRSLLIDTVRGAFGLGRPARSKVMPWILVAILALPPVVIALTVLLTGGDELPVSYTQYLTQLQLPIGLFVAGAAPYAVSRDLRYGVMPLYLSRPMLRTDYVAARYGGLAIAVFLVMVLPQTLLFVGALLANLPVGDQIAGWTGGLLASLLLAVLLAALGLAVAAFTPRRGLGVAAIITILLVVSGISFALSGIAESQDRSELADLAGALDPFRLVDGLASQILGVDPTIGELTPTTGGQVAIFALVYVVIVGACGLLLVRRYRKASGL